MKEEHLASILQGCVRKERASQELLFDLYYNYAMSVAVRYIGNYEEAEEIVSDSFVKIFSRIDTHYSPDLSFKGWLRRIVINTAIDRYRTIKNKKPTTELNEALYVEQEDDIIERLTREQILRLVQQLPPQYRAVFNLHIVDGFSHTEIGDLLGINEVTSRSNLSRARQSLKQLLQEKMY
jgi:RNA polymerase sigma-70 factor, ECF subfamily